MPFLRAVLSVLIVFVHLAPRLHSPLLHPLQELGAPIVSVFLFISGFGLYKSYLAKGEAYLQSFFRVRITRLLIPALLTLLLFYLVCWTPDRQFTKEWQLAITKGILPLPQLWYVFEILYYYLLFYFAFRIIPSRFRFFALFLGAAVFIYMTIHAGYDQCWWICSLSFPAGVLFSKRENNIYAHYGPVLLFSVITFFVLYFTGNRFIWIGCYLFIPSIVALLVSVLPLERYSGRIILFLASISYELFLCHEISLRFFRGAFIYLESDVLFTLAAVAGSILLAALIHWVSSSFIASR